MTKITLPDFVTPAPGPSADDRAFLDAAMIAVLQGMLAHPTRYKPRPGAPVNWHDAIAQEAAELAHALLLRARKGGA